uniref:Uncharacterized protein n=1 Tax=Arundo donax TaxID=35708 RepID=A0A0A9B9T3_ARUDO
MVSTAMATADAPPLPGSLCGTGERAGHPVAKIPPPPSAAAKNPPLPQAKAAVAAYPGVHGRRGPGTGPVRAGIQGGSYSLRHSGVRRQRIRLNPPAPPRLSASPHEPRPSRSWRRCRILLRLHPPLNPMHRRRRRCRRRRHRASSGRPTTRWTSSKPSTCATGAATTLCRAASTSSWPSSAASGGRTTASRIWKPRWTPSGGGSRRTTRCSARGPAAPPQGTTSGCTRSPLKSGAPR